MEAGQDGRRPVGLWGAVAIGIGGMVGGGIFAVLGLSVQLAEGGAPVAFLVAGAVALLTARSYALLSRSYPDRGGTVTFVDRAFGTGSFSGSVNVLLWISYVVMLALYSQAFGSYGASFLPGHTALWKHVLLSAAIVLITALNVLGAAAVARSERVVVAVKIAILVLFVAVGAAGVEPGRIAPAAWGPPLAVVAGGMIIFLAYEGFELIANAAEDVPDAGRTLPAAYYISVVFVIVLYVSVAAVAVGSLPVDVLVAARDYALAVAAQPVLGRVGFAVIGVAALLSTASAINATLYGSARLTSVIATAGELPLALSRPVWHRPIAGLLVTAGATLLLANVLDLESISVMGSAGFLVIFAVVNAAEASTARERGSRRWVSVTAAAACLAALAVLVLRSPLGDVAVLVGMVACAVVGEVAFRRVRKRHRPA